MNNMTKNIKAYIHIEMTKDSDGFVHINNKGNGSLEDITILLAYLAKDKPLEYHLALDTNIQSQLSEEDNFMKMKIN